MSSVTNTRRFKAKTIFTCIAPGNSHFLSPSRFLYVTLAVLAALLSAGECIAVAPYQQDSGSQGLVSIEVEEYTANSSAGGHAWEVSYPEGHSGSGALEAAPNSSVNNSTGFVDSSPRLDYQIKFTKAGTHYIWVRALGASGKDDSLHVGLNGAAFTSSTSMGNFSSQLSWNNRLMAGSVAIIDVPAAGEHTLNIWMREDGVVIDKLVLATSSSYVPSGTGPSPSLQQEPVVVGNSLPIDLRGVAPEQALVDHYVSKPGNALGATLTLATFDADMVDEGELVINGNTPIPLFGDKAHTSNDDQNVTIELTSPAEYWRDGKNSLVFRHNRTVGYSINSLDVAFSSGVVDGDSGTSDSGSASMNLNGTAPEEVSMTINVTKPATAAAAVVTLDSFDADFSDEGELIINGNPPLALFGSAASSANDGNSANIDINTPASYWRDGDNTLVFRHTRTSGFIIDNVVVGFSAATNDSPANHPPTLSGTPATSASVGDYYLFQPAAADVDGDGLVFSISNRPSWADFDTSTGRLSGVPGQGDGGTEDNIRISVNDGSATASLPAFNIIVAGDTAVAGDTVASPGSITLRWNAPSTREDGTPLSAGEIAGYTLFYGTSPGNYTSSIYLAGGDTSSKTFSGLPSGKTFYIVMTASDASGLQSAYSNSAQVTVQ